MDRDNQRDKQMEEQIQVIRTELNIANMHLNSTFMPLRKSEVEFLLKELDRLQGERDKAIEGLRHYAEYTLDGKHARTILKELGL